MRGGGVPPRSVTESGSDGRLVGVKLHASSAAESQRTLRDQGIAADIHV